MGGNSVQDEKFIMMTEAPVEPLVCKMAVPTIITMMISALYNMADTYFVGTIGTSATAAVGVVFSLMAIIQAVGFFFGHGAGNYISRQLGAQNFDEAAKMAATGFFSALLSVACLSALALMNLEPLARFLGATDTILPYACDYMKFILIAAPFMAGSLMLNNLLRFQGSAFYGMIGMTTGAVMNIILDPILIYVFNMGVSGASFATMLSQMTGCAILLIGCTKKGNVRIHPKNFSPSLHNYKEMFRGGTPSLCRQGLASVATIVLNQTAGGYGDSAIAAMSIVTRVTNMCSSALLGFGQGFQPVCGFNYGAQKYDRVRRAFFFCVKTAFVFLLIISASVFILAPQVVALFRKDDGAVIRIGAQALRYQCIVFPLMSWITLCNMMLQTIGKVFKASILAISRQGMFLIPLVMILSNMFGIKGIQISQPIADILTFSISVPMGISVLREMKKLEERIENKSIFVEAAINK